MRKFNKKLRDYWKFKARKKSLRKKYNNKCELCGSNILTTVHHKIPVRDIKILYQLNTYDKLKNCKLLWDINWLTLLCNKCHNEIDKACYTRITHEFHQEYALNFKK